jgi:hypothetical protein
MFVARYTATGEPSARNADRDGRDNASAKAGP